MTRWHHKIQAWRTRTLAIAAAGYLLSHLVSTAVAQEGTGGAMSRCDALYEALNETIDAAGVRNGATFTVPGIPWFRTSRFLHEIRYFISDEDASKFWLEQLAQEGRAALLGELAQLPEETLVRLIGEFNGELRRQEGGEDPLQMAGRMVSRCLNRTLRGAREALPLQSLFVGGTGIPDEYRMARRILGLYPLFALPVGTAVATYRRQVVNRYAIPLARLTPEGRLERYTAGPGFPDREAPATANLLASASKNPLAIPELTRKEQALLAHRFAPVLELDIAGRFDIPGAVHWQDGLVAIDPDQPTLYYYASHAILQGRALLQLNYVLWYTERPRRHAFDIEAGRIDGLTLRLTLDETGRPIMVDAIHNCGCYHFFFPSPQVFKAPRRKPFREDAFVPQWLPPLDEHRRLAVRIESKRHRVDRLSPAGQADRAPNTYVLVPYEMLEALPRASGKTESIFTPRGLMKGKTERPERFLLFSVGIPWPGSMRQRGHHPTALIGRRMFDDPRLFENFFSLEE